MNLVLQQHFISHVVVVAVDVDVDVVALVNRGQGGLRRRRRRSCCTASKMDGRQASD